MRRVLVPVVACLLLLAACISGCSSSESSSFTPSSPETGEVQSELEDGVYSCEAYNATRGNGPYSLECEKSGDELVIHFNNGGHITLDIDSQSRTEGSTWEITATHYERGDSWELTVTK